MPENSAHTNQVSANIIPNANSNESAIITAGAVAASAAIITGSIIYDKMTGDAYSENDRKRLAELTRLYHEIFQISPPISWVLDDKYRPTHRIKNQKWSLYVQQQRQHKQIGGNYHYQSNLIVEYASTYLTQRGERWTAAGKTGDLVELFIADWIHFALNELPIFGFDDISVQKINRRITYTEQVQKHESLFQFGLFTRDKNKLDTIESIKQQLKACVDIAEQESLRQCAREKFDVCRSDISVLLLSCAQTLYYARATYIHMEPLELLRFIEPDGKFLTASAKNIYGALKKTHTGEMLAELASLAGLNAFGSLGEQKSNHLKLKYFTKHRQMKTIKWETQKADLPPWVEKSGMAKHLTEFQSLGESILRVANLKELIEKAYDLTGKVGDLWAYGDKQGKLSMKALLFLLKEEVTLLKNRYDTLYLYHNTQRYAYNLKYRINPNHDLNQNFNKVDIQKNNTDHLLASIKAATQSMCEQLEKFPENSPKQVDFQKEQLYQSIAKYIKQFHPTAHPEYWLLERTAYPSELNSNFYNRPENEQTEQPPTKWRLGNKYELWMNAYFANNKKAFDTLKSLSETLKKQVEKPRTLADITAAATALQNHILVLKKNIADERPAWRFKLGIWPILTKGWPFNQEAHQFAKGLLKNLDTLFDNIQIDIKITSHAIIIPDEPVVENPTLFESFTARDLDNQHYEAIKTAFIHFENGNGSFLVFRKKDEPQKMLKEILNYRDELPKDLSDPHITTWSNFGHVISLSLQCLEDPLDQESFEQMELVIQIIDLLKTEPHTEERRAAIDAFNIKSQQTLSKRETRLAIKSYSHTGLLGTTSNKTTPSTQTQEENRNEKNID